MQDLPRSRAVPLADEMMTKQLFDFVTKRSVDKQGLKKGANQTTKAINRDQAQIVLLAADTEPLEIVLHLPLLCQQKNVPYVFVDSQVALGRASNVSRSIIACAVLKTKDESIQTKINDLKDRVEQLML